MLELASQIPITKWPCQSVAPVGGSATHSIRDAVISMGQAQGWMGHLFQGVEKTTVVDLASAAQVMLCADASSVFWTATGCAAAAWLV